MLVLSPIELTDDQRREHRVETPSLEFLTAVFRLDNSPESREYEFPVLNYSRHGLGLLIPETEHILIESLQPGYEIMPIRLMAQAALTIVKGTVRHITRFNQGQFCGDLILGLESMIAFEYEQWETDHPGA